MYDDERLSLVFDKTDGDCAYCGKQLAWSNYGLTGARGAWEVDHRKPLSRGGTDHMNNLSAACVYCNREKGNLTARQFDSLFEPSPRGPSQPNLWDGLVAVGVLALFASLLSQKPNQGFNR